MKNYVGVQLIEAVVGFDMVVNEGELALEVLLRMIREVNSPQGSLEGTIIDFSGPSGHPVVELRGAVEDLEAFFDHHNWGLDH